MDELKFVRRFVLSWAGMFLVALAIDILVLLEGGWASLSAGFVLVFLLPMILPVVLLVLGVREIGRAHV